MKQSHPQNEKTGPPLSAGTAIDHPKFMRVTHVINFVAFVFLTVSGIAILFAHPELYWGQTGVFGDESAISLPIPRDVSLSGWGRNYHFLFAWIFVINGLVYVLSSLAKGHVRRRLVPDRDSLRPDNFRLVVLNHLRLRPKGGKAGSEYNVLQKLTYLVIIFVVTPLMILTGLAMSPAVTAAVPVLLDLFGGRQSARTLHFLGMLVLLGFLAVHVFQVLISGLKTQMRGILTGKPPDTNAE